MSVFLGQDQFAGNKPIMFVDIDGLEIGIPNINKFKYGDNIALNVISVIDNGGINILNLGINLVNTATYVGDNIFHPSVIANQTKSEFQELAKNVRETTKSTYTYHTQTPWKKQVKDAGHQLASAEQWEVASTFAVGMAIGKMDFSVPGLPAEGLRLVKAGFSLGSEEGAAESAGNVFNSSIKGGNLFRSIEEGGQSYEFNSGHSFNRPHKVPNSGGLTTSFEGSGITMDQVERSIVKDIKSYTKAGNSLPSTSEGRVTPYSNTITINNKPITYKAIESSGVVKIADYYIDGKLSH